MFYSVKQVQVNFSTNVSEHAFEKSLAPDSNVNQIFSTFGLFLYRKIKFKLPIKLEMSKGANSLSLSSWGEILLCRMEKSSLERFIAKIWTVLRMEGRGLDMAYWSCWKANCDLDIFKLSLYDISAEWRGFYLNRKSVRNFWDNF